MLSSCINIEKLPLAPYFCIYKCLLVALNFIYQTKKKILHCFLTVFGFPAVSAGEGDGSRA